ncbi:SDR family oxidoreductase [Phaeobacter porticola]|uniref:Short chain dehydrogenase / reductase n=1 Tax=Phaeobacter porticola TaxID=1844006 RepID=A0A1L3I5M5_9RHOB|nr:SDR family NAD(P)-dependent oxidoreductase [Phaeobacter porticola]APG47415.1 short chain dehydrogenase / reductase [Phaeobacter porticola]
MNISGKHIVITGGASGIGLGLLQKLQERNDVSVIARPSDGLARLRKTFPQLAVYEADFADAKSVERAADGLVKSERPVDILINNAAVQYTPRFLDNDFRYETIQREIDINFTSICALIYLLMPSLLQANRSMIVNINSGLGLVPKTSSAIYCATKGALNIFSQSLRHQLADTNIDVKQVFLPLVDTAMTQGRGAAKLPVDKVATEIIQGMASSTLDINVGKVKALRIIQRLAPSLATKIMKSA